MIDFYYSPTPNGWKVAIMLEECGIDYKLKFMDLTRGDQFDKAFLSINPNAKIPAIVDHDTGSDPVTVFESGAILIYLAEKTRLFGAQSKIQDKEMLEWLFWQTGNLGPMAGQLSHFVNYAPEQMEYGLTRYRGEYERCLGVLEKRLDGRDYILGEYSIADIMNFPWVFIAKKLGTDLANFPALTRWRSEIKNRPAVRRAIDLHKGDQFTESANASNAPRLFNQSAAHLEQ